MRRCTGDIVWPRHNAPNAVVFPSTYRHHRFPRKLASGNAEAAPQAVAAPIDVSKAPPSDHGLRAAR